MPPPVSQIFCEPNDNKKPQKKRFLNQNQLTNDPNEGPVAQGQKLFQHG